MLLHHSIPAKLVYPGLITTEFFPEDYLLWRAIAPWNEILDAAICIAGFKTNLIRILTCCKE
jgi:hypothetical protein